MNEIKPIVLKARTVDNSVGVVRLTPEAEKVVRRLCGRRGRCNRACWGGQCRARQCGGEGLNGARQFGGSYGYIDF